MVNNKEPQPDVMGLILAGGHSRRMGRDKALLSFHGTPQVVFLMNLLSRFCRKVFVSIREDQREQDPYRSMDCIVDQPEYKGQGPLAGLLSAFLKQPDAAWFVTACDVIGFDEDAARTLIGARDPQRLVTAFSTIDGRLPEPLIAIYEPQAFSVLKEEWEKGHRCPRGILQRHQDTVLLIRPDHPYWVFNCNDSTDWETFHKTTQQKGVG